MFFFWIATTNFYDEPSIKVSIILSRTTSIGISLLIMIPKLLKPPLAGIPLGVHCPHQLDIILLYHLWNVVMNPSIPIEPDFTFKRKEEMVPDQAKPISPLLFEACMNNKDFSLEWSSESPQDMQNIMKDTRNNLYDFIIYCAAYQVQHHQRLFTSSERQSFRQKNHSSQ